MVSVNPPVLGFSTTLDGTARKKDTLNNIEKRGEFVVNIASYHLVEQLNKTSAAYSPDINEFNKAGLTESASAFVDPPRVAEAMVHFECRLREVISFGDEPLAGQLILGDVCGIHINDEIYLSESKRIDVLKLDTLGRMEGSYYCRTGERFDLARPVPES